MIYYTMHTPLLRYMETRQKREHSEWVSGGAISAGTCMMLIRNGIGYANIHANWFIV